MQTLVMIPRLGSDAAIWRRTINALDGAFDCVIGDTASNDSLPGMAQRILALAPDTFALAGVSMGGMVALQIMAMAPGRVTRLALTDTNARPIRSIERLSGISPTLWRQPAVTSASCLNATSGH